MEDLLYYLRNKSGQIIIYNQDRKIIKGKFETVVKFNELISIGKTVIKVFDYSLIGHRLTNKESQIISIKSNYIPSILDYELETTIKCNEDSEEQKCIIKGQCKIDGNFNINETDYIILIPIVDTKNNNQIYTYYI